ncbi:hypothetical protein GCM10009840_07230 [Pseudolysinimonas kribbensis]
MSFLNIEGWFLAERERGERPGKGLPARVGAQGFTAQGDGRGGTGIRGMAPTMRRTWYEQHSRT